MLFALLVPLFMVITGGVLYIAYQQSLERGYVARMTAQLYGLLAVLEPRADGVWMPEQLLDERFNQPQSGLFAQINARSGERLWRSASALGIAGPERGVLPNAPLGQVSQRWSPSGRWLGVGLWVQFEEEHFSQGYQVQIWQSGQALAQERRGFTTTLAVGLGGLTLGLLLLTWVLIRWVQRPLRQVTTELDAIEQAVQPSLSTAYPSEIAGLTRALNRVLSTEREQRERYAKRLADLAHSLKTPLAVIQAELADAPSTPVVVQQLARMDEVIAYQLKRAVAVSSHLGMQALAVAPVIQRICEAMTKLYHERAVQLTQDLDKAVAFVGDEGDLMEILGNLIDNACKYCQSQVQVNLSWDAATQQLVVLVQDDGPGLSTEQWVQVQARGARLDQRPIGQGIGLAVVAELVADYQGQLSLLPSEGALSGARVRVALPGCLREPQG